MGKRPARTDSAGIRQISKENHQNPLDHYLKYGILKNIDHFYRVTPKGAKQVKAHDCEKRKLNVVMRFFIYSGKGNGKMNNEQVYLKIMERMEQTPDDVEIYGDCLQLLRLMETENAKQAHERNRCLRKTLGRAVYRNTARIALSEQFYELYRMSLLFDAPLEFDAYMQYVEWNREPEKKFYMPRRKVMLPVVKDMQRLIDGELDLLTISMPPGTGKSTLGIFFLSWVMGRFPDQPNLASAHSGLLTRSFYDGVSQIITDPEYLWRDVFPGLILAGTNSKEETIDLKKKHRFSTLTCRAINASLTGATRCEKILYADDLCSGIEEALSRERMDTLWTKYSNDLKSRKKLGAKEIHIATRWTVHDVIGRLERMYGDDPRAKFISLPALDENGESNFSYDHGVGFTAAYFEDMRRNLDDASFRALYLNEPVEREGLLYHEEELRRYFSLPETPPDAIIAVCDTKDKGKDYAFLPVAYVYGEDYYIEDCVCDNGLPEQVDGRLAEILLRHRVQMCRFESNSAGGRIAEKVQNEIKARGGVTHITTRYTTANKETKIIVNSAWVKEHCLFRDNPSGEYRKMLSFLCGYTMAGKNKNDDVPDGMAMLSEFAQSMRQNRVEIFQRPF